MTIYLSGAMSIYGPPTWGRENFDEYAKLYRAKGYTVFSPPEMDWKLLGRAFTPGDYAQCLAADVELLTSKKIDAIFMLPDWRKSRGARLERFAAETIGIPVYNARTGELMDTQLEIVEVPTEVADVPA